MIKICIAAALFGTISSADILTDTKKPALVSPKTQDAKSTVASLTKNENAAKGIHPQEKKDIDGIQNLNKKSALLLKKIGFHASTESKLSATGTLISAEASLANIKISEDTSVIASTDKTAY